eukprot:scaffold4015_cov101-Isochrysis_galbana.AAC.1
MDLVTPVTNPINGDIFSCQEPKLWPVIRPSQQCAGQGQAVPQRQSLGRAIVPEWSSPQCCLRGLV